MTDVVNLLKEANEKAISFFAADNMQSASILFKQILKVDPQNETALHFIGLINGKNKNYDKSIQIFSNLLQNNPKDYNLHNNIALVYMDNCELDKCIFHLKQSIKLNPSFIPSLVNLGLAYEATQEYRKAIKTFKKAYKLDGHDVNTIVGISHAYSCIHDLDNAFKYCQEALSVDPENAKANFNMGLLHGLCGNWDKCFEQLEWRWNYAKNFDVITEKPRWNGIDSIKDKRILVYSEQGIGDLIQFARYIKLLKSYDTFVILECTEPTRELLQGIDGVDVIRLRTERQYDFDYYVSILSLPYYFGVFPVIQNYIRPIKSDLQWNYFGNVFKIGITWAGNPAHANDCNRSFDCRQLENICNITGVKLFSLQKDRQKRFWPKHGCIDLCKGNSNMKMIDLSPYMGTFASTASLINEMDLIISVDTAIAHLAGAIGKKTWLLLPYNPDWRWRIKGSRTLWYESMIIFRQSKINDWDNLLTRVENEVKKII